MALILSHPFRLGPGGQAVTVDQDSDAGHAEQLAVLVMTRRGERPLALDFGLPDPAFRGIEPGELTAAVDRWGPPVLLASIDTTTVDASRVAVRVAFA